MKRSTTSSVSRDDESTHSLLSPKKKKRMTAKMKVEYLSRLKLSYSASYLVNTVRVDIDLKTLVVGLDDALLEKGLKELNGYPWEKKRAFEFSKMMDLLVTRCRDSGLFAVNPSFFFQFQVKPLVHKIHACLEWRSSHYPRVQHFESDLFRFIEQEVKIQSEHMSSKEARRKVNSWLGVVGRSHFHKRALTDRAEILLWSITGCRVVMHGTSTQFDDEFELTLTLRDSRTGEYFYRNVWLQTACVGLEVFVVGVKMSNNCQTDYCLLAIVWLCLFGRRISVCIDKLLEESSARYLFCNDVWERINCMFSCF